jgi:hypothetical protein
MGEKKNAYKDLAEKPEGKKQLGRPRHRWEDNIEIYLKGIGWKGCGLDASIPGYGPLAGCYEHGNE